MNRHNKQVIIDIIAAIIVIACGVMVITEALGPHCYWFNYLYFIVIIPSCITLSDVMEWAHPDYFTKAELERKGR